MKAFIFALMFFSASQLQAQTLEWISSSHDLRCQATAKIIPYATDNETDDEINPGSTTYSTPYQADAQASLPTTGVQDITVSVASLSYSTKSTLSPTNLAGFSWDVNINGNTCEGRCTNKHQGSTVGGLTKNRYKVHALQPGSDTWIRWRYQFDLLEPKDGGTLAVGSELVCTVSDLGTITCTWSGTHWNFSGTRFETPNYTVGIPVTGSSPGQALTTSWYSDQKVEDGQLIDTTNRANSQFTVTNAPGNQKHSKVEGQAKLLVNTIIDL